MPRWTKEQFEEWCRKQVRQNPGFDPNTYKGDLVGYDLRLAPVAATKKLATVSRENRTGQAQTLNKTEQKYWEKLKANFPDARHHAIKLQLAEKCWYTPDFHYVSTIEGLVFIEVKGGFERDDAIVKLKTAARLFPQFTFIKAKYVKGQWTETIMPR